MHSRLSLTVLFLWSTLYSMKAGHQDSPWCLSPHKGHLLGKLLIVGSAFVGDDGGDLMVEDKVILGDIL